MNRYLLDTNILVYLLTGEIDIISSKISLILEDYTTKLFTSSISILELQQLYRIGKIKPKHKSISDLIIALDEVFNISILPFGEAEIYSLAKLNVLPDHNDPFDHAIISHAISNKITLISSDKKFDKYINQNLSFVFNKR